MPEVLRKIRKYRATKPCHKGQRIESWGLTINCPNKMLGKDEVVKTVWNLCKKLCWKSKKRNKNKVHRKIFESIVFSNVYLLFNNTCKSNDRFSKCVWLGAKEEEYFHEVLASENSEFATVDPRRLSFLANVTKYARAVKARYGAYYRQPIKLLPEQEKGKWLTKYTVVHTWLRCQNRNAFG